MNLQPVLKGTLVTVRPLLIDDYDDLFKAASDPLIWEQHSEPNRFKSEIFQKFFNHALDSKGALVIIDNSNGEVVGSSRYYEPSTNGDGIHIGYTFLIKRLWGGNYNREIKSLMVEHAFKYVPNVFFHVSKDNLRSQAALKKIGAQYSHEANDLMPDGITRNRLVFSIKRTEKS